MTGAQTVELAQEGVTVAIAELNAAWRELAASTALERDRWKARAGEALDALTAGVALAESLLADEPDRDLAHALLERVQVLNTK